MAWARMSTSWRVSSSVLFDTGRSLAGGSELCFAGGHSLVCWPLWDHSDWLQALLDFAPRLGVRGRGAVCLGYIALLLCRGVCPTGDTVGGMSKTMLLRGPCSQSFAIVCLLFQFLRLASSSGTCGSLITYRRASQPKKLDRKSTRLNSSHSST